MPRTRKTRSGTKAQPIRDIPRQPFGEGEGIRQLQQAAPLQGDPQQAVAPPPPQGGPGGRPAPVFGESAFRPTERAGEPITSGIPFGPGPSGQNQIIPTDTVDSFLRALYQILPDDAILRLLKE